MVIQSQLREALINTISNLNKAVETLTNTIQQQHQHQIQHESTRQSRQPQPNATSNTFSLEDPFEDEEEEEEGLAIDRINKTQTTESILRTQSSLAGSETYNTLQQESTTHQQSISRQVDSRNHLDQNSMLSKTNSKYSKLDFNSQSTQISTQQDFATIRQNFQDIFLTQFHYLNNRKKELYILQSTNGEVAQVFKSLGHEGHLEGADQLRLAQAIAFYNESQKLEKQIGRGQQQFRGSGRGFNNRPFNNQFNTPEDNTAHWQTECQEEDTQINKMDQVPSKKAPILNKLSDGPQSSDSTSELNTRVTGKTLEAMEEVRNSFQPDASVDQRRSTNSVQISSISNNSQQQTNVNTTSTICGPGNNQTTSIRSNFASESNPNSGITNWSGTKEKWQNEDDNRSQICQHLHSSNKVQKQGPQHSGTNATTRRLSSNSRSTGWILPCANQAEIQNLSRISMEREILPIQCPSIWIGTKPLDIYQVGQTSSTVSEKKRTQNSSIHGQFHPYGKYNNRSNFTQEKFF